MGNSGFPCLLGSERGKRENMMDERYLKSNEVRNTQSEGDEKCNNCTLEELAVLRIIAANPTITQKDLAALIGKSERTIKTRTVALQEKGYLRRSGGKRNGRWEVLIEI